LPFLRLEAATPTEVEKTIEQQAEQINLLRAELDNERKERQGKKTEIEVMKEQIQTLQKTMSELEGIFRESLRVSREIKKKTGAKE
jgi:peptidoglycan hydrolase CwlO-like protein